MATTRSSARDGKPPHGFATIRDILDGRVRPASRINLIGIITDFRAPIHTKGEDWKCAMRIYDQSVENEPDESVLLNIFRPQNEMPDAQCGDVVIAFSARVQHYQASYSLITHKTTDLHIYESSKIPKACADASKARRPSQRQISRQPSKVENEFVSVLYSAINKERIPTQPEFEVMKINSTNIKNKFSELKDIRDGIFIDATVQIVREPYDLGDRFTLWVSDYTEHPSFYKYKLLGEISYPKGEATSEWTGPLGNRSMQITCYEPHASVIRDQHLSAGTWISLKNLQIKFGHNEANLEGYLREDRGAYGIKINISQVNHLDGDTASPELKSALRRKRKYEEQKKAELIGIDEAAEAGRKRKAQMGSDSNPPVKAPKNAKQKRSANRAHKQEAYQKKVGQLDDAQPPKIEPADHAPEDLNTQIKYENNNKPATSIAEMLAPAYHEISAEGERLRLQLPFINANYRTYVRVIDFLPSRLEQFAKPKKISEYAALSDDEQSESELGSDSENESLSSRGSNDKNRQWEWRFHLRLEDASSQEGPKKSIWVTVDNLAAEMLLSLDASDLRRDDGNLANLRKKMWLLWGDLEEHKAVMENRALKTRHSNNANAPPAHSDDEAEPSKRKPAHVSNRSFGCCIRQYGATVAEGDETKADAGDGKRWQRMFGLFGTQISRV